MSESRPYTCTFIHRTPLQFLAFEKMSVQYNMGLTLTPVHGIMGVPEAPSSVRAFGGRLYSFPGDESPSVQCPHIH